MQSPYNLIIHWLRLWCNDTVANEKVNDHNRTIRFEASPAQGVNHLVHIPKPKIFDLGIPRPRNSPFVQRQLIQVFDLGEQNRRRGPLARRKRRVFHVEIGDSPDVFHATLDDLPRERRLVRRLEDHGALRRLSCAQGPGGSAVQHTRVGLLPHRAFRNPQADAILRILDVTKHLHAARYNAE